MVLAPVSVLAELLRTGIPESVRRGFVAVDVPCIQSKTVRQMERVSRIAYSGTVWILAHGMERQRFDSAGEGRIEVHLFGETIGVQEIITRPTSTERGQARRIELQRHFIST